MELTSTVVGLQRCEENDRAQIKDCIEKIAGALSFTVSRGATLLLKPNLVSARNHDGLACTHKEFIAAVAEWCVDQGAKVRIGDSPAFGSGVATMDAFGITEALKGLPVELVELGKARPVKLDCGYTVGIGEQALDCDMIVNLPKLKSHVQLFVSLAIKNYFGCVVGFRKAWLHSRHGHVDGRFEKILVDLLGVLPSGISFVDGIIVLHNGGPVSGDPFPLGMIAGSVNPVAADTAIMAALDLGLDQNLLLRECRRRSYPGSNPSGIAYPLLSPADFSAQGFITPKKLMAITFNPYRLARSALKKIVAKLRR